MSIHEIRSGAISRFVSAILVLSMLICSLPLYINSASIDENYDLPWLWPVPGSYVITALDYYASGNAHGNGQAIDIGNNGYSADNRLDVVSATNGEVLYIQNTYNETTNRGSGWGNYVIVKSGNVCIIYGHLQSVSCKYGKINAGDVIGKMGNTGNSTGVHLHLQAYPYDQKVTSTDIHVFDKYINNPLYVSNFKFQNGVINNSKLYSSHLGSYYKTLTGEYNAYSGGYLGDYAASNLGATVKSIRTSGARIYSQPLRSSTQAETVAFGNEITVYGYYTDAYGNVWYLISEKSFDKWIPESDVGFSKYTFGAKYDSEYTLGGAYGKFSDIQFSGKITVANTIKTIRAEIKNEGGVVASYENAVNSNVFEIDSKFSEGFGIDGLADGKYKYEILVTENAYFPGADVVTKTYSAFSSDFTIDKTAVDEIPPLVEEIKIMSMTDTLVKLSVKATDNRKVQKLTFTVTNQSGFSKCFDSLPNNTDFTLEIPFSALNGAGNYTVTAKALDPFMNTDESSLAFTVPEKGGSEVWKVQVSSSLKLRSGPGQNYSEVGKLKNNNLMTVTEVYYNSTDSRYWANVGSGWCALQYAVYQSGYLYNVTFNLLGGSGNVAEVKKAFGQNATIPNITPTRTGYTFLGWSTDPAATTAEYKPGDTYLKNASAILFAVWEDKTAPSITEVTLSAVGANTDYVTISVKASDNSGTLYYSFDGGVSYTRLSTNAIYENKTITAKTIVVKDPAGNVSFYNTDAVISNIGTKLTVEVLFPGSVIDAKMNKEYFIVNAHSLTADSFISQLKKQDNAKVYDKNGTLMNGTDALIYSGCKFTALDSAGVYRTFTIVILGDADRNGKVTYEDVTRIMKLSNGMAVSTDVLDNIVCDLDGDGKITSIDASKAYSKTK